MMCGMECDGKPQSDDPRVFLAVQRTPRVDTHRDRTHGIRLCGCEGRLLPAEFVSGSRGAGDSLSSGAASASLWLGVTLVMIGVGVQAMASADYLQFERRYVAGKPTPPAHPYQARLLASRSS